MSMIENFANSLKNKQTIKTIFDIIIMLIAIFILCTVFEL